MELTKKQKEFVLARIAEGLETDEINARAAKCRPAFSVSRQQVDYYRESRGVRLSDVKKTGEVNALAEGFALREERLRVLNRLAEHMETELFDEEKIWTDDVKMIGTGVFQERIEFKNFNRAQINMLRALLDDLAKEVGDRKQKVEHTGEDGAELPPLIINIKQ